MATQFTLAQLLTAQTQEQVFQVLLGVCQAAGFPVQSWQDGGVELTRLLAISTGIADFNANYIPNITAGGFLDFAPGTGWMPLLAQEMYNLAQNPATFTQGTITLTNNSSQPYTIVAGKLTAVFGASGNRYINTTGGTLAASGGTLALTFQAENPGAKYNDPSSSGSLSLVNPLPGVTLTNIAGSFSTVSHVGAGTGTLTLGGSPSGPHQVVVRIDASGQSGAASWSTSLDGGAFTSQGTAASITNLGSVGINITLANGAGTPSFIQNDTYTFNTPGSWITSQGANVETDTALAARCKARWATLSNVGVTQLYQLLAMSTPTVGSQVTQVIVQPDANINNKLNIIIAGPAGVLPAGTVSAVQSYVTARVPITVNPVVSSPTTQAITIVATITCSASLFNAVQSAVTTALNNYIASVPINGTIRLAAITELIMEVNGVIDVSGVTINGSASNLTLGGVGSYVMPVYPPTLTLNYITQ